MQLTPQAQAVLLLNVRLGKSDSGSNEPLTPREWEWFAGWLKDNGLEPSLLLKGGLGALPEGWERRRVTRDRLHALLNRGAALGLSLERWERAGLWVLTRSDPEYPKRLKRHLDKRAPAVLFGCGNKALLERSGIAVVGSRNAGEDDLEFACKLGAKAAEEGYSVVSGGARGIDRRAMLGALKEGGAALAVLTDSLLRSAMAADYRQYILSGDLALISPFNPEARFHVGKAMERNAYIYCLADAAVVVNSTTGKGGTWNGAEENRKRGWVPLWVKPDDAPGSGNPELVRRGAQWLPEEPYPLSHLIGDAPPARQDRLPLEPAAPSLREEPEPYAPADGGLYSLFLARMAELTAEKPAGVHRIAERLGLKKPQAEDWLRRAVSNGQVVANKRSGQYSTPPCTPRSLADGEFYGLFLGLALKIAATVPMRTGDIAAQFGVRESQAADWLKRAVDEGRMVRRNNPVRYRAVAPLFADDA